MSKHKHLSHLLQELLYHSFGKKQVGKLHKHLQQKLLKISIDTKFRPAGSIAGRQLYHIWEQLSIGKMHKNKVPPSGGHFG